MNAAILSGIKDLQSRIEELTLDLEISQEQVIFFKKAAGRVKSLETEIKNLRAEVLILTQNQEKVLKSL